MNFASDRIQNPAHIDADALAVKLTEHGRVTIQFSTTDALKRSVLADVNRACARFDDRLQVRFYGFYGEAFDGEIIHHLPEVKNLTIDCLTKTRNIGAIRSLNNLRALTLGVFDLAEPQILEADNLRSLRAFGLWETQQKIDLAPLSNWRELRHVDIRAHGKNLEKLAGLPNLETLTLGLGAKAPLGFVNHLPALTTLKLILGGRENLNEVVGKTIETFEVIRVRGLCDLSTIASWSHLKNLNIEDQMRLEELNFSSDMTELTNISILNCKTLSGLKGLRALPKLKSLRIYGTNLNFEALVSAGLPNTLNEFAFYTLRRKEDRLIHSRIKAMGYRADPDHFFGL